MERNDEPLLLWRRTVKHLRTMLSLAHKHRECLSEREETIAANVMVRTVPGAGRGLFAGRNFRKGELVFQEEPLVSASLLSESCCDCCLAYLSKTTNVPSKEEEEEREGGRDEGEEGARCMVCQRKEYCREDCKASAHRKYHHRSEHETAMLLEEYPRLQRHLRMHGEGAVCKNLLLWLRCFLACEHTSLSSSASAWSSCSSCSSSSPSSAFSSCSCSPPPPPPPFGRRTLLHQLVEGLSGVCSCFERDSFLNVEEEETEKEENTQLEQFIQRHNLVPLFTDFTNLLLPPLSSFLLSIKQQQNEAEETKSWLLASFLFLHSVLQCNAFGLCHHDKKDIDIRGGSSVALFLQSSLFNHSCQPNIKFQQETKEAKEEQGASLTHRLQFLAKRDVRKGEELCISYIPAVKHVEAELRRDYLNHSYGFLCECPLCAEQL